MLRRTLPRCSAMGWHPTFSFGRTGAVERRQTPWGLGRAIGEFDAKIGRQALSQVDIAAVERALEYDRAMSANSDVIIRQANERDSENLAVLASLAGGDTITFILKGINPATNTLRVFRDMIAASTGIFSYRNCLVAEIEGRVAGLANAFPARLIADELKGFQWTEQDEHLRPRTELNDPKSFLLNNLAVCPESQRNGIGKRLVQAVVAEARQQRFRSLTLHVWADNTKAIAFYRKLGLKERGRAPIPWHPDLPHVGGSLLFKLAIRSAGP